MSRDLCPTYVLFLFPLLGCYHTCGITTPASLYHIIKGTHKLLYNVIKVYLYSIRQVWVWYCVLYSVRQIVV